MVKISIFISLLLLFVQSGISQKKSVLEIYGGPDVGFYQGDFFFSSDAQGRNVKTLQSRIGVNYGLELSSSNLLLIGFQITNHGDAFEYNENQDWGGEPNNFPMRIGKISKFTHRYLSLMFGYRKSFSTGKFSPFLQIAVLPTTSLLMKTSVRFIENEGDDFSYKNSHRFEVFNLEAQIGGGVTYKMNEKVSFYANPSFQMQLLDEIEGNYWSRRFWNAGVQLGAIFSLPQKVKSK